MDLHRLGSIAYGRGIDLLTPLSICCPLCVSSLQSRRGTLVGAFGHKARPCDSCVEIDRCPLLSLSIWPCNFAIQRFLGTAVVTGYKPALVCGSCGGS